MLHGLKGLEESRAAALDGAICKLGPMICAPERDGTAGWSLSQRIRAGIATPGELEAVDESMRICRMLANADGWRPAPANLRPVVDRARELMRRVGGGA